ncbi:hypothetical protein [Endozoicomonas sp. G2_1]|nr:hypothetical protein [Endozoicomonas sp. G2_1]
MNASADNRHFDQVLVIVAVSTIPELPCWHQHWPELINGAAA